MNSVNPVNHAMSIYLVVLASLALVTLVAIAAVLFAVWYELRYARLEARPLMFGRHSRRRYL